MGAASVPEVGGESFEIEPRGAFSLARLQSIADGWSPYRSWVGVLVRADREARTGEIGSVQGSALVYGGRPPGEVRP